jgi:hypothetical protein
MYFIGGAFSVLMLITALTEEGFNPGNYLFYCIIVLIGGMITDTIMKNVAAKGIGKFGFLAIFVLLLASLSIVSQYFYCATMNKGIRDREGK